MNDGKSTRSNYKQEGYYRPRFTLQQLVNGVKKILHIKMDDGKSTRSNHIQEG